MSRRRADLDAWREWRRAHYFDGDPRGEVGYLLDLLLSTRRGAIAVLRSDRREAKRARPQHTPPMIKDADYLHAAYGRRRGRTS
jgi:hypothetical protein